MRHFWWSEVLLKHKAKEHYEYLKLEGIRNIINHPDSQIRQKKRKVGKAVAFDSSIIVAFS